MAGGAEAAITPIGVAGYASMGALSRRNDEPELASRPFDVDRDGFVIAEGAGVLVLEERAAVIASDGTGVARRMPPYDLTRNGTLLDGEVLYVLDLGAETRARVRTHFPERDLFRYQRPARQVRGTLVREP